MRVQYHPSHKSSMGGPHPRSLPSYRSRKPGHSGTRGGTAGAVLEIAGKTEPSIGRGHKRPQTDATRRGQTQEAPFFFLGIRSVQATVALMVCGTARAWSVSVESCRRIVPGPGCHFLFPPKSARHTTRTMRITSSLDISPPAIGKTSHGG